MSHKFKKNRFMNVVFSMRKDQKSKNGLVVLYWYLSFNGQRSKKYSSGIRVQLKDWKGNHAIGINSKPINDAIGNIKADLTNIFNNNQNSISHIQEITDLYLEKEKENYTFLQLYDMLVERKILEKKKSNTIDTYKTFRNVWLIPYLKSSKNNDLLANNFTYVHLEGIYEMMLKSENIESGEYIKHQLSKIRATVLFGYSKGIIEKDAVAKYKIHIPTAEKEYIYLDTQEVEKFEKITFLEQEMDLQKDRDLFLLQCYTGLSFNEIIHFDKSNIKYSDGWTWIEVNRGKTNGLQLVPLFDKALQILKEFDYSLPKLLQHKYNPNIRSCAYRAKIDKYLHSHLARNTCGAYLLNMGISLQVVSRVLGHKNIKTTEKYYAKIQDMWRVKNEFNKVFRSEQPNEHHEPKKNEPQKMVSTGTNLNFTYSYTK